MPDIIKQISALEWLRSIPTHVPKGIRRYYLYWKIFYFAALLAHGTSFFMFAAIGVDFMKWFNIVSVVVFLLALALLHRGYYRLAFWGVNAELIAHGVAATVCIGPIFGMQNFVFPVVILSFIQPFYSWRVSAVLAGGTLAFGAAVMLYAVNHPPIYTISETWTYYIVAVSMFIFPASVLAMVLPFIAEATRSEKTLEAAYDESERLLLNILPKQIAARLKSSQGMIADDHERVAILFADIVGFTTLSTRLQPAQVVTLLNDVFNAIDALVEKYGVEKIKTIGDAYMVVAGLPDARDDSEAVIARLALDILSTLETFTEPDTDRPVQVRIGINSGRVVAGVIGQRKFAYDLWGDAVNVAARMEATGEPGKIQVPESFAAPLSERFDFEPRGEIDVKGKGKVRTSFLVGEKVIPCES